MRVLLNYDPEPRPVLIRALPANVCVCVCKVRLAILTQAAAQGRAVKRSHVLTAKRT